MNPVKRFLGDTSSEQFRVYDTSDEAEKHVSIFGGRRCNHYRR